MFGWNDGVKGRAVVNEQHSHISVFLIQMCESIARASSLDLFSWYANWRGSMVAGTEEQMWFLTSRLKHFITGNFTTGKVLLASN